ncbi:MAG: endonuclease [Spirochaetae bacterium HGW-Spirochaetae-4]|jgi:protein FrlC|nr:MAG: endonuclease [Spirochaetae bacterium HGW-Spirochaetae-4]
MKLTSDIKLAGMNITYRHLPMTRFLDDMVSLGFTEVELWGGAPHFYSEDITQTDISVMRMTLAERGLSLVCFTPEQCLYPINIASADKAMRERSIDFFRRNIEITVELGCDLMLVTPGRGYVDEDAGEAAKRSIAALIELTATAERQSVRLGLEVLRRDESDIVYNLKTLKEMVDSVDSPSLGALLDTIPMALAGEEPADYLDTFEKKLFHIHFIDGAPHGHLAWGDGILDAQEYLRQIKDSGYSGSLSLEITDARYSGNPFPAFRQSVDRLKAIKL